AALGERRSPHAHEPQARSTLDNKEEFVRRFLTRTSTRRSAFAFGARPPGIRASVVALVGASGCAARRAMGRTLAEVGRTAAAAAASVAGARPAGVAAVVAAARAAPQTHRE